MAKKDDLKILMKGKNDKVEASNDDQFDSMTMAELIQESLNNIVEGEVVKGTIVAITDSEVIVDIGFKSEGSIPISEFTSMLEENGKLKVGDKIDVYLEKIEDAHGLIVLSKEKADKIKIWDTISEKYESEEKIKGRIVEKIKGGLTVDIGVRAFLPGSQIDLRPVKEPERMIGKIFDFKIIKLNKRRGNIVLSRRAILEKEQKELKKHTLEKLKPGTPVEGIVKNIVEYGVFIDLGGIDGLLHITDMSWGRINHPSEMFKIGDKVNLVVLKFDSDTEKVSLGLKQKTSDPWESVDDKYPIGKTVTGKVISLTDYGSFVELEEGVEGLIHISEMSWTKKIRHPSKILKVNDNVEAIVLKVEKENKRISLSLKQISQNPWDKLKEEYPEGATVEGTIRNFTNFGAFVEIADGIDGLIHISDISWSSKIKHASDVFKKGQKVKVKVLEIDPDNEKLSLGYKQLQPNPWDLFIENNNENDVVNGEVKRLSDFGAFVELESGVEGLVHISELDERRVNKASDIVNVGEIVTMKILKIDFSEKKVSLSIKAAREKEFYQDRKRTR